MLEARYKDPDFGKIFIPMLENELIDSNRSTFFLEKLESRLHDEQRDDQSLYAEQDGEAGQHEGAASKQRALKVAQSNGVGRRAPDAAGRIPSSGRGTSKGRG